MTTLRTRPALLFYCQHSLGMGHLVRSLALARALAARFDVTLLNGGRFPDGLRAPSSICVIDLPPLGMAEMADGTNGLVSLDPRWSLARAQAERQAMIARALAVTRPSAIVIELFPFGRKKFAGELLELLAAAHAMRPVRPLVFSSLRDLLVGSRRDQDAHDDRASLIANRWFDAIFVHADPAFARLEESFRPREPLRVPVHYTGFVTEPQRAAPGARHVRRVLISAGGGMVGFDLFRDAIGAQRLLAGRSAMRLVAGPFLPEPEWRALGRIGQDVPDLELVRWVPDLASELAQAAVSVSQCGYNTALELIATGVRPIVVPFAAGREDEQGNRARRLAERGLVQVIEPAQVNPAALARAIDEAFERGVPRGKGPALSMDGAPQTACLIDSMLEARSRMEAAA